MNRRTMVVAGAGVALWPVGGRAQGTPEAGEAAAVLRRYIQAALIDGDRDAFDAIVAADIPAQNPDDARGRDALWQRLLDAAQETEDRGATITLEVEDVIASGSTAAARATARWDDEYLDDYDTTGDVLVIAEVADGQIARLWTAWIWHGEVF